MNKTQGCIIISGICLTVLISCSSSMNVYPKESAKFAGKYSNFLEPGEKEIETYYHYMISKKENGKYVFRQFFPETMQLTKKMTGKDKKFKKLYDEYKEWFDNGEPMSIGNVINNERDGLWALYNHDDGVLRSEGMFKNGLRVGQWKKYHSNNTVSENYSYANNMREGAFVKYDSLSQIISSGFYQSDTIFSVEYVKPLSRDSLEDVEEFMPYIKVCSEFEDRAIREKCSNEKLLKYIYNNIRYPADARMYGLTGSTRTSFTINKDGSVSDVEVSIGLCQSIKDECIKLVTNMPQWHPGMQNGEKVRVQYNLSH